MRYELIKNEKINLRNDYRITIFFEDEEIPFMKQMLEMELDEEFKEAEKLIKKMMKVIKNRDAKKLYEIEDKKYCLSSPLFTQEEIDVLESEKQITVPVSLVRYRFMDKLSLIEDRNFINSFKEIIKFTIENDSNSCLKEEYLKKLAVI